MLLFKPTKNMKRIIYVLILLLVVVSGLVFATRVINKETKEVYVPKPLTAEEKKAAMKQWESTPEGMFYVEWKKSPAGKKVFANIATIRKSVNEFSNMEATVTSLSLPPGSRLGYGIMVQIKGEDYILSFGPESTGKNSVKNDFTQLHKLKVNDKIIVKSHNVSHAPKYAYPIVSGDYIELDGKEIYKRVISPGGC
jgi:hypothetical protein